MADDIVHGTSGDPVSSGAPASAQISRLEISCVPPSVYTDVVAVDEAAFFGVFREGQKEHVCREIWTAGERIDVLRHLAQAQSEMEDELGYHLCPTWVEDEEQVYSSPVRADWTRIISGGVRGEEDVVLSAVVDHTVDPSVIGPLSTSVTDESEIRVYYPGTDQEIETQLVEITNGSLTIYIPRYRMVHPDHMLNDRTGLDYNDTTLFLQTVDVKRVFNDTTDHGQLVWRKKDATEATQLALAYLQNAKVGYVDMIPARLNGSLVKASPSKRGNPDKVRLNYYAGLTKLPELFKDAVIRLAHSRMPDEPCACEVTQYLWKRDRNIPTVMTRERINCPFGIRDGAWASFKIASKKKMIRASVL